MPLVVVLIGFAALLLALSLFVNNRAQTWLIVSTLVLLVGVVVVVLMNTKKRLNLEWSEGDKSKYAGKITNIYAKINSEEWIDQLNNDACVALSGFGQHACDDFDKRMKADSGNMTESSMKSFLLSLDDDQLLCVGGYTLRFDEIMANVER